MKGTLILH